MKHRVLLRRALPLAVLAAVLYSAGWPASAFFFQKDEAVPSVAAMTKMARRRNPSPFLRRTSLWKAPASWTAL